MTDQQLIIHQGTAMPVLSIQEAVSRWNQLVEFTSTIMRQGVDYGVIPGTDKPTLLKPGAEKLCTLFGLLPQFEPVETIKDWDKGFFYFHYRCNLTRNGVVVASGEGSCNTKEKKYRWRTADRVCPNCGKPTIFKSKEQGKGFYCWAKRGGCGATFTERDPAIVSQPLGQIENTEPFDLVNTVQKMAQKRALIAATLIGVNASEFYTQDMEDMVIEGEYATPKTATATASNGATVKPVDITPSKELIAAWEFKSADGECYGDMDTRELTVRMNNPKCPAPNKAAIKLVLDDRNSHDVVNPVVCGDWLAVSKRMVAAGLNVPALSMDTSPTRIAYLTAKYNDVVAIADEQMAAEQQPL